MTGPGDFWSRRRAGVKAEAAEADAATPLLDPTQTAEPPEQQDKSDEQLLSELDLPDPDTLENGDDFSVFMDRAVPERLRRRALRSLWRSNPVLANVDGLVDYGEDFSGSANVVENLKTAYQVGKGLTKHVEEMARQQEREAAEAAIPPSANDDDRTGTTAAEQPAPSDGVVSIAKPESDLTVDIHDANTAIAAATPEIPLAVSVDPDLPPARPPRMQFAFEA